MEIALQPCGFLSAYLGSFLLLPDADLYFRNLDGRGHIHQAIDTRGKRLTNEARLVSSTFIQGVIIQKFEFRVTCEGQPFYTGESVFGYFTPDALVNQVGLDGGKKVLPWYEQSGKASLQARMLNLHSDDVRRRLYQAPPGKPHYHLSSGQLDFLDQVMIVEGGGKHGQGYIHASRRVDPVAWFYVCHFYQDPVMPGSLGIEAIIQAMQAYALQLDLGRSFQSPHFDYLPGHEVVWKYRGQIVRECLHWSLEVHISSVQVGAEQVVIMGDASLWREQLRIYEITNLAICIKETQT
jgi:3-hydroxymyristoyl/3-hydroxydecanoyl-(acyl carrier protein) dehydratase